MSFEIAQKDYLRLRAHGTHHRLIDVRTIPEWRGGHIDGAELLTLSKFAEEYPAVLPDKNEKIIIYCAHGERSLMATDILRAAGYADAWSLESGYHSFILHL